MSVHRMANPVMAYAWGSRDGIATLRGKPASSEPEAELWMGAHPRGSSVLEGDADGASGALDVLIAADPFRFVGPDIVARFGPRLPFMLKVLAAAEPLSLQVHPDDDLARERCAAEDATGLERDAPQRAYRDPYAKPELLVAVTDFELLLGFRPAVEAAEACAELGVRRLDGAVGALRGGTATGAVFLTVVEWPDADRAALVAETRAAVEKSDDPRAPWIARLADRYPTDPGVVGILLLNYRRLSPGQGVYIAPGQIHTDLRGVGIEALGNSDNVVRAGLTPKHVTLAELRRMMSSEPRPIEVIEPTPDGRWITPRPEFALSRLPLDGDARRSLGPGPAIVFCLEGKVEVNDADATVMLNGGDAAFVTAGAPATLIGDGVALCATAGLAQREPVS